MTGKLLKVIPWALGILLFTNVMFLDFVVKQKSIPAALPTPRPAIIDVNPPKNTNLTPSVPAGNGCPTTCVKEIEQTVQEAINALPTGTEVKTIVPKSNLTPEVKTIYLTIGSSGSTSNTIWSDIPGTDFYFDLSDYPKAKSVRWEVSLQSYLSNDPVYIRLYDVSNNRSVDGSDMSTHSSTYVYLRSSDLTIWRGNNLYRIQAKGSSGNVVNFISPRLKIILE